MLRSKTAILGSQPNLKSNKRKADASPPGERRKRSALGNLTNANATNLPLAEKNTNNVQKTTVKNSRAITSIREEVSIKNGNCSLNIIIVTFQNENKPILVMPKLPVIQKHTRASLKPQPVVTQCIVPKIPPKINLQKPKGEFVKPTRRLSNDFERSENSLYVSALEDL